MRPNAGMLARRDPALAALFGIVAAAGTSPDFGSDGADFGAEFGDDYGDDYGSDFGAEFGAAVAEAAHQMVARGAGRHAMAKVPPPPAHLVAAWHKNQARQLAGAHRAMLLDPNEGSSKKIERFTFSISTALVVGTASSFTITNNPDTTIRPQRVTMAVPTVGFVLISEIKVANVSVTVGGVLDAFQFSPLAVGQALDMPTLSPANRVSVIGNYTGFIAPGLIVGSTFTFAVSFTGPSNLAG